MRMNKQNRGLWAWGLLVLGAVAVAGIASADVTDISTERSGSIIVFPKVLYHTDSSSGLTTDTIIEITNTSNTMVHARCFYINAGTPGQWNETDFDIWLTKQQPTHWVTGLGRSTDFQSFSAFGSDGAGFDPGLVPAMPLGFEGELKCVQVDTSDAPLGGNALVGKATLRRSDGDVSDYNAIAFQGNTTAGAISGNDLTLDLTTAHSTGEYSACPNTIILNHFAEGTSDPVVSQLGACGDGDCPISTELTLVPCQEDLENQVPGVVTATLDIANEFEQHYSSHVTVNCWFNESLGQISSVLTSAGTLGSTTMHTRITPNPGSSGIIGVAEEHRRDSNTEGPGAGAAFNLNSEGNRFDFAGVTDHIVLPEP